MDVLQQDKVFSGPIQNDMKYCDIKENELKIFYKIDNHQDHERCQLEKDLEELLKKYQYEIWSTGLNTGNMTRDLNFDKIDTEIKEKK